MNKLIRAFNERNIDVEVFKNREMLINELTKEISKYETIGIGNSATLKSLGVSYLANGMGKVVYDKTLVSSKEEIASLKKKALLSQCYISSCNGIAEDGTIVNIDHSGNRVAAMTYGPDRVLLIVGLNKISKNEKHALSRALTVATPKNAIRAKIQSPCSQGKDCSECSQEVRVCNYISIIRGQHIEGRMKIFILEEELGF